MTMAATLLLRSSCIPPDADGVDDAINPRRDGGTFDERLARSSAAAAATDDVAVLRAPITAGRSATTTSGMLRYSQIRDGADFHERKSSISSSRSSSTFSSFHTRNRIQKNDILEDFEYISSHPIQCDVSLIPRLPITTNNDDTIDNPFNDTKDHTQNDNTSPSQQPKQRGGGRQSGTVLHFPRQSFHPCGMNNVIVIDRLLPSSSTSSVQRSDKIDGSYLLSLTQCALNIDRDRITTTNPTNLDASLPVLASPSTFQFSFHNRQNKLHSTDHISDGSLDLSTVAVGDIHVSFDYSLALEYYHEFILLSHFDTTHQDREQDAMTCEHTKSTSFNANATFSSSSSKSTPLINDDAIFHHDGELNEAVASLRQSIMNESLFLTQALIALGCMGIVFIIALVWAIRRIMNDKGKRLRVGRRNNRRLVLNDGVPSEIGMVEQPSLDTAVGKRSGSDPGASPSESDHDASPLMSPLRPSTIRIDDIMPMQPSEVMDNGTRTIHETLHLISPSTPSHPSKKSIHSTQCVEECSTKSLRHWYEDYLSPPGKPNNHSRGRSHSDVNEVVSSFDFTPLAPSAKCAAEGRPTKDDEEDGSPIEEDVTLQLSSRMESSSIVDDESLGGSGDKAQLPVMSFLVDACDDFPDESTVNGGESSSRASVPDPEIIEDQCDVIPLSCASSICTAVVNGSSQSLPDDIANAEEETVCDVDIVGSSALGLGQELVYDCFLPKDSIVNDKEARSQASVSDPEMIVDQCNFSVSSCPSPTCNVAEDESICNVDLVGSIASGLGQKLVYGCSLLDACDDVLKDYAVNDTVASVQASVLDPEMTQDQYNVLSDECANHTQEEAVCDVDLAGSNATVLSRNLVTDCASLNCVPKIKIEQSPCRFAAELVERATGTKAPSPNAASNEFSTLLAQRAFEIETGKSVPAVKKNFFASSLAKRVAEVEQKESCSPDATPVSSLHKRKPLTPLGSCESSQSGVASDEFLSDYW